ncbi:MAG: heparin lyase I family protein [Candidatus Aenigmatarchaeota archaeon]
MRKKILTGILLFFLFIPSCKALTYSQNSTNNTVAGFPTLFRLKWLDPKGLCGYIFSTNNSGEWINDSFRFFHGSEFPRGEGNIYMYAEEVDTRYKISGEKFGNIARYTIEIEKNGSGIQGEVRSLSIFGNNFALDYEPNLGFYVWNSTGYAGSGGRISRNSNVNIIENGPVRVFIHSENTSSSLGEVSDCLTNACWNSSIDIYAYPKYYIQTRKVWGNFSAIQMYVGGPTWQVPYVFKKIAGYPAFSAIAWYFVNGSYYDANNSWGNTIKKDNFMKYVAFLFDENRHDKVFGVAPLHSTLSNNPQSSWYVESNPTYYFVSLGFNGGNNPSPYAITYVTLFAESGNKSIEKNYSVWLGIQDQWFDLYYPADILMINGIYEGRDNITLTYNFTSTSNLLRFNFSTGNYSRSYPVFQIKGLNNISEIKKHVWYRNVTDKIGTWQNLKEGTDFLIQEGNSSYFNYDYILISLNAVFNPNTQHEFWVSNDSDPLITEDWSYGEKILNQGIIAWKFYANNSLDEWNESETFFLLSKSMECIGTDPPSIGDWIISENTECKCAKGTNITVKGNIFLLGNSNLTIDNCLIWIDQDFPNEYKFQANGSSVFWLKNSILDSSFSFILSFNEFSSAVVEESTINQNLNFFDSSISKIKNSYIYFSSFNNLRNEINNSTINSSHFTKGENFINNSCIQNVNFLSSANYIFNSNITYGFFENSINFILNSRVLNASFKWKSQNTIENSVFLKAFFEEDSIFSIYNSSFDEIYMGNSLGNYPLVNFIFPITYFKTGFETLDLNEWDSASSWGGWLRIDNESVYEGNYSLHIYNDGSNAWSHQALTKHTINKEIYIQLKFKLDNLPPPGKNTGSIITLSKTDSIEEGWGSLISRAVIRNENGKYVLMVRWFENTREVEYKVDIDISPNKWHELGFYTKIDNSSGEYKIYLDKKKILEKKNIGNDLGGLIKIWIGSNTAWSGNANWPFNLYIDDVRMTKDENVDENYSIINKLHILSSSNTSLNGDFISNQIDWEIGSRINRNFTVIVRYFDQSLPLAPIIAEVYDSSNNLIWSTTTNYSYIKVPLYLNSTNFGVGNFTLRITDSIQENYTQIGFVKSTPLIIYLKPTKCEGSVVPASGDWIINVPTSCTCSPRRQLLVRGATLVYSDFNLSYCTLKIESDFYARNFSRVNIINSTLTAYLWPSYYFEGNSENKIINTTFNRALVFRGNSTNLILNSYSWYYSSVSGESKTTFISSNLSELYIFSSIPHNLTIQNLFPGQNLNYYVKARDSNFTLNLTNTSINSIRFYALSSSNNTILNSLLGYSSFYSSSKNTIINTTFIGSPNARSATFFESSQNKIINSTFKVYPSFYGNSINDIENSVFYNQTNFYGRSKNRIENSVFYNQTNFYEMSSSNFSNSWAQEFRIGSTVPHTLTITDLAPGNFITKFIKASSPFTVNLTNVNITSLGFLANSSSINNLTNFSSNADSYFEGNSINTITDSTFSASSYFHRNSSNLITNSFFSIVWLGADWSSSDTPKLNFTNSQVVDWHTSNKSKNSIIRGWLENLGSVRSWGTSGNATRYYPIKVLYFDGRTAQGINVSITSSPQLVWTGT